MTFVATANAVITGATPRFADVTPDDMLISPAEVAAALTPATRAIIAVDYAGHLADYDALRGVCGSSRRGRRCSSPTRLYSLGATRGGRRVGTLADLTVLSLHPARS